MAKIVYKEGVEPLSGIYCGIEYKTYKSGANSAVLQRLPTEKEAKKNPAARAELIVKLCVANIQRQMSDPHEAIKQYTNIMHRVQRLYGRLYELEKNNDKLQQMILDAYYGKRRVLPSRRVDEPRLALDVPP